jgi:hypothetical protein
VALPSYKVKLHWHSRFNADPGNAWLRSVFADLFAGGGANVPRVHRKTA